MTTTLITSIYKDQSKFRFMEMVSCLCHNAFCEEIDNIIVITDQDFEHPVEADGLKYVRLDKRPTYQDMFDIAEKMFPENELKIVANGDIYFQDEDVRLLKATSHKDRVVALSRWDLTDSGIRHHAQRDSQDAWVFLGNVRKGNYNYPVGFLGCDNRLAHELTAAGYEVVNPSKTIRSYHLHRTNIRTYTRNESYVVPPPYHFIKPTYIGESKYLSGSLNQNRHIELDNDPIVTDDDGYIVYDGQAQKKAMLEMLSKQAFSKKYILTVAIPTMNSRAISFNSLMNELNRQIEQYKLYNDVQIYPLRDNGQMPIGYKRNWINMKCSGKYVIHLDDDDSISPEYLINIVSTIKNNPDVDVVTFNAQLTYNGDNPEIMIYNSQYTENHPPELINGVMTRLRMPSHINAIKRELCLSNFFPVITRNGAKNRKDRGDNGSDVSFSESLVKSGAIKRSAHIGDVLYYYKYIQNKS